MQMAIFQKIKPSLKGRGGSFFIERGRVRGSWSTGGGRGIVLTCAILLTVLPSQHQPVMELVILNNGKATTTSVKVAEYFGKQHGHVIRAIETLLQDLDVVGRSNFGLSSYLNEQNKQQPMYELDRDGFSLLAMGFTGKKALQFKLSYIDAFNKAEQLLVNAAPATPEMQIANAILIAGRMIEEQN